MKSKKCLVALLLSFLMVLSQMSVAAFALDTAAPEGTDQTVTEQAVEETQPEANTDTAAENEAAAETAAPEAVEAEVAAEPAKAEAAAEPAKAEEAAEPAKAEVQEEAFDQSKTVDGVTVTVRAAKGVFPAGSELSVSKVAVPSAVDTSDAETAYAFDISILANGEKIQPDGNAEVSFTTTEVADHDTAVYHMDGGAQKMSVFENGETASVKTDGFSVYVLVLKDTLPKSGNVYSGKYNASPGDTITLKDIIDGIDGIDAYDNQKRLKRINSVAVEGDALSLIAGQQGDKLNVVQFKVNDQAQPDTTATITAFISKSGSYTSYTEHKIVVTVKNARNVRFDLGEAPGNPPETQIVASGGYAEKPESDPEYKNHTFLGWFEDGATEAFDFENTQIEDDITLFAHWSHKHQWETRRSTDLTTLYVKCKVADCPYGEEKSLTVDAPGMIYTGDPYDPDDIGLNDEEVYKEFGAQIEEIEKYQGTTLAGEKYNLAEPPTDAGTYKVHVKITNDKPGWNWLWAAFDISPVIIKVTEPQPYEGLVYDGSEKLLAEDGVLNPDDVANLKFAVNTDKDTPPSSDEYVDSLQDLKKVDAGTYYIWYLPYDDEEVFDNMNYRFVDATDPEKEIDFDELEPIKVDIAKATPKVTAPVAKTLTYNTQAQELAEAGKTTGGTMLYALGTSATTAPTEGWSTSVPKGTNVGSYYVWYKVAGDKNYNDVGPVCVTATIAARQFTITYDLNGGKLNGQTGTVTMTVEEGTVITLPAPTRDGYTFDYWEGSKYNAGDKYTVTGDHTFKAVWKTKKGVQTGDSNDIAGLLALMIVSVGALGAIGYRRRREDHE